MRRALLRLRVMILAWLLASTAAAAETLPLAADLAADGRAAAGAGRVIVLLYSLPGCPWCERVRTAYLAPLARDPDAARGILLREIDIDSAAALVDFAGGHTTHREFARRNQVRFTPLVAFLGPDGEALAAPLAGFSSAEYYGAYLERRIAEAAAKSGPKTGR